MRKWGINSTTPIYLYIINVNSIFNRVLNVIYMADKKLLKDYTKEEIAEFSSLEKEAYEKANKLNKEFIHIESLLNDLTEHWKEYFIFLENQKISKICEFYGDKTAPFDDELREVIAANLKSSLNGVHKSVNYNTKKIDVGRIIDR